MAIGKETKQNAIPGQKEKKNQHHKLHLPDKNAIKLEKVYSKYSLISTTINEFTQEIFRNAFSNMLHTDIFKE